MSKNGKSICAKLIANPGSGTATDRGVLLEQVTRYLKDLGVEIDVAVAKPKEEAEPIAKRAVKDGYKVIIGMGGDDTIESIIRGMAGSKARLGIIPVGTANDLAKSLGIPQDPQAACSLIASGKVRKVDLGVVKARRGKPLYCFELVTVGIAAAIYPDALKVSKGRLDRLKSAVEKVLGHDTNPKVTVVMNDESRVTVETMLVIVSNVPLIGPKMLVDPDASMEDGLFDITLYPGFSKAELLAYFAKTLNESPASDGRIQHYRAHKVKIKSTPKLDVMSDGVMLGKGKVKIKVLPRALRVFAPAAGAGVEPPPEQAGADLPPPVAPAMAVHP